MKFYEELDDIKENSFKKNNEKFDKDLDNTKTTTKKPTSEKPKAPRKPRAPRTPRAKTTEKKPVQTVTEETEDIESPKE